LLVLNAKKEIIPLPRISGKTLTGSNLKNIAPDAASIPRTKRQNSGGNYRIFRGKGIC